MNLYDERVRITKGREVVGEYWVKFDSMTGESPTAEESKVRGNVKVKMSTWFRPVLQGLIDNAPAYNIEFLRGYAPESQVVAAYRKEDRRYMVIEV